MHALAQAAWESAQLEEIRHHWGDAYEITDRGPGWRARRRDRKGGWLVALDVEGLYALITADYQADPVSRDVG